MTLEGRLDQAGHKETKQERIAKAARERILNQVFGTEKPGAGYADPALMFK